MGSRGWLEVGMGGLEGLLSRLREEKVGMSGLSTDITLRQMTKGYRKREKFRGEKNCRSLTPEKDQQLSAQIF